MSQRQKGKTTGKDHTKTIYVGNLPFRTTRYELKELFQPYGKVHGVRIMINKATRKPRGYGFVEMPHDDAAKAIAQLDGTSFIGRNLKISEANDRG
ncbi:MAG: RNA-binding protein [Gammaproteobacteria bacterium]